MGSLRYAVLGPLASRAPNRAFLGCVVRDGVPRPDEPVAVIWLPDELAYEPDALTQLQRQAEWVRALRHPHVVGVLGIECFDEGWARIVEMIDGEPMPTVAEALRAKGRLTADVVVRIGLDAAAGLQHAHEFGETSNGQPIVHGGVRPETLMMSFDGRTQVSGFGASAFRPFRTLLEGRRATAFLAPEQLLGGADSASVRTDVYGLAAVLFELLTGAPPFWEEAELERAILTQDLAVPLEAQLPEGLAVTLRQALHRKSPERFASMADFAAALVETGPCSRESLQVELNELFPPDAFVRTDRRNLLASASDLDAVAILEPRERGAAESASTPWSEARDGPNEDRPAEADTEAEPDERARVEPEAQAKAAATSQNELEAPWVDSPSSADPREAASRARSGLQAPIAPSRDLAVSSEDPGEITHFDQQAGDGSRMGLAIVAVLAFVCIGAVAWFGKGELPAGLRSSAGRHELPPEMLAGAFETARNETLPEASGPLRSVDISATPAVDVYRGDERLGRTPLQAELRAGLHELRLTDGDKMINVYRRVEVPAEGSGRMRFALEPASVTVDAPAGAQVFLNDVQVGRAPLDALSLYEGRYLIQVHHRGRSFREPLQVAPGAELRVTAVF